MQIQYLKEEKKKQKEEYEAQIENLKNEHKAEIENVSKKVRALIESKEQTIQVLNDKLMTAQNRLLEIDKMFANQKKTLPEKRRQKSANTK